MLVLVGILVEFDVNEEGTYSGNWLWVYPHWTNASTVYNYSNGTSGIASRKYGDKGFVERK